MQITKHSEFFRAEAEASENSAGEIRYYPVSATNRETAMMFDNQSNPVRIMGFAVFDYSVSKTYAICLFNSHEAAEAFVKLASCPEEDPSPSAPENAAPADETTEAAQPDPEPENKSTRGKNSPFKRGKKKS
jgi:hypothetical protein